MQQHKRNKTKKQSVVTNNLSATITTLCMVGVRYSNRAETRINKGFLRSQNSTLTQNLSKTPTENSIVLSFKSEMRENNA